jgi:hypothetical protein
MKQGRSIVELAQELERQRETRKDYLAQQSAIRMELAPVVADEPANPMLSGLNGRALGLKEYAHGQLAGDLRIPKEYYDRMRTAAPELLATNVNAWLGKRGAGKKLVRTLDGNVRAWLSPKYRPLDNAELAEAVLPTFADLGAQIESAEVTDLRLYLKATIPSLKREVRGSRQVGDIVTAGIVVSNSEVGAGAVRIEPLVMRLVCLNGLIVNAAVRKYHVGRGLESEELMELLRDETRRADDRVFWAKVRDVVEGSFRRDVFDKLVDQMETLTGVSLPASANLAETVDVIVEEVSLPRSLATPILHNLAAGSDLTAWGVVNAVTATANTLDDYELATDIERAGGKLLGMEPSQWGQLIAKAA